MKNLKLKTKISIIVILALIGVVIIGVKGLSLSNYLNNSLNEIVGLNVPKIEAAEELTIALMSMQRAEKDMVIAQSQEDMDKFEAKFNEERKRFDKWNNIL